MFFSLEPPHHKTSNLYMCQNKDTGQLCSVTAQVISAFVFLTQIVQSLFYLNTKFQASSLLEWLYRPVCVRPGPKPKLLVCSCKAHLNLFLLKSQTEMSVKNVKEQTIPFARDCV